MGGVLWKRKVRILMRNLMGLMKNWMRRRKRERESEGEEEDEEGGDDGIEDGFLKIKELEFLEEDEVREYGLKKKDKKEERKVDGLGMDEDEDEDEDEDGEDEDDDEDEDGDELGDFGHGDDEDADKLASYGDFFGAKKKKAAKQKSKLKDGSEESDMDDEQEDDEAFENKKQATVSTHEKELENLRSKVEQMEKANLDPKAWTTQGEVTAARRPLNSALEVDLDFEHNTRPAPVITEEVTATLEDLIKKRILEGQFDDVQKAPVLPSKAPREVN